MNTETTKCVIAYAPSEDGGEYCNIHIGDSVDPEFEKEAKEQANLPLEKRNLFYAELTDAEVSDFELVESGQSKKFRSEREFASTILKNHDLLDD